MNSPPREILEIVIGSLRHDPSAWKFTEYRATNAKLKAEIWLSNRYYGTALQIGSCRWGGVTVAGSFLGWIMPWRRKLLRAADTANLRQCLANA